MNWSDTLILEFPPFYRQRDSEAHHQPVKELKVEPNLIFHPPIFQWVDTVIYQLCAEDTEVRAVKSGIIDIRRMKGQFSMVRKLGIAVDGSKRHTKEMPFRRTFENKSVFSKSTLRPGKQKKKDLSSENSRRKITKHGVGSPSAKCLEEHRLCLWRKKFGALLHRPRINTEVFTQVKISCMSESLLSDYVPNKLELEIGWTQEDLKSYFGSSGGIRARKRWIVSEILVANWTKGRKDQRWDWSSKVKKRHSRWCH